jgi:O-antigen/teichoic acid export membrane protein
MTIERELSGPSLVRAGVGYAPALLIANLAGYLYHVVMSRWLGPADYGAVAALVGVLAVGLVPATALQILVARHYATGREFTSLLRPATWLGLAAGGAVALGSGPLSDFLHIPTTVPVLITGVAMMAALPLSALMGIFHGSERFGRLAFSQVTASLGKLGLAVLFVALGAGVPGAMLAVAGSFVLAILVCLPVPEPLTEQRDALPYRQLAAITGGLAALMAYAGLDLLLARHLLSAVESGNYAVGSVFTRVALWLPAFIPILTLPRLSREREWRRTFGRGAVVVLAVDGLLLATVLVLGEPMVALVFGSDYQLGPALGWFVALGAGMALLQLITVTGFSQGRYGFTGFVIAGGVVTAVAISFLHSSVFQVAITATIVTVVVAVAGSIWLSARR